MRDVLTTEGWEFVAVVDERQQDEPCPLPETVEEPEVWRRQVGGRVEWCELCHIPLAAPELPPERCWHRQMWPVDPRTIED